MTIFENWRDIAFRGRRLYVREELVVNEWTATATKAARSSGTASTSSRSRTASSREGRVLRLAPATRRAGLARPQLQPEDVRTVVVTGRVESLPLLVEPRRI